jgi:hypothetical protein
VRARSVEDEYEDAGLEALRKLFPPHLAFPLEGLQWIAAVLARWNKSESVPRTDEREEPYDEGRPLWPVVLSACADCGVGTFTLGEWYMLPR